jgi:cytochrome P450 family 135
MADGAPRVALPPGPAAGPLAQTVALHRDPLGVLRRTQERHGDVFTLRLTTVRPLVVVARAAAAAELLAADPGSARAGEARRRILPLASPRSMFGADGEAHRAARHRLAPLFAPEAIAGHRVAIAEIAGRHVAAWPRGRPIRLLPRMRAIVDEVFIRRLLGVTDADRVAALTVALRRMLWTPGNPPLPIPGDGVLGTVADGVFARRRAPLARLLTRELEERRAAPAAGGVLGRTLRDEPDVPVGAIVDELLALLMAAQEPAAAALTWTLERLARDPGLAEEYRAGAPRDSPSARAAVDETLRLRPPAVAGLRRLSVARDVLGRTLPAGIVVMLPLPVVHRDADAYPDPDAFRLERWLGPGPSPAAFWPFGGGARRCVGEALAREELRTVVPEILSGVGLRALGSRPERMVLRGTILVPHRSGLVVAGDRPVRRAAPPPEAVGRPGGIG